MSPFEVLLQPVGVSWVYVSEEAIAASTEGFGAFLLASKSFCKSGESSDVLAE